MPRRHRPRSQSILVSFMMFIVLAALLSPVSLSGHKEDDAGLFAAWSADARSSAAAGDFHMSMDVPAPLYAVAYLPGAEEVDAMPIGVFLPEGSTHIVSDLVPARAGHTFDGWLSNLIPTELLHAGDAFQVPAAMVTLTAQWVPLDESAGNGAEPAAPSTPVPSLPPNVSVTPPPTSAPVYPTTPPSPPAPSTPPAITPPTPAPPAAANPPSGAADSDTLPYTGGYSFLSLFFLGAQLLLLGVLLLFRSEHKRQRRQEI